MCFYKNIEAAEWASNIQVKCVGQFLKCNSWETLVLGTTTAHVCDEKGEGVSIRVFIARDLISVINAFGEDGMLRYWGVLEPLRSNIFQYGWRMHLPI